MSASPRRRGLGSELTRATNDRIIAGVASGVARRLGMSATLVRLLWAGAVLLGGFGVLPYVVLWVVLPKDTDTMPALRIAEERFARGEIEADELDRIKRTLAGG